MAGRRLELCNRSGGSGLLEHHRRLWQRDRTVQAFVCEGPWSMYQHHARRPTGLLSKRRQPFHLVQRIDDAHLLAAVCAALMFSLSGADISLGTPPPALNISSPTAARLSYAIN